jgi:hypothetical protein
MHRDLCRGFPNRPWKIIAAEFMSAAMFPGAHIGIDDFARVGAPDQVGNAAAGCG